MSKNKKPKNSKVNNTKNIKKSKKWSGESKTNSTKKALNAKQIKRREYYKRLLQRMEQRKPAICKYFIHGSCKLDDCGFSHDVTPDQMIKLNEPCKYYPVGECVKGEMCCFMHGDFPCNFFHNKTGNICKKGDKCLFSHNPLTEETASALKKYLETQENRGQILPVKEPVTQYMGLIQPNFGKSIICANNENVQANILNISQETLPVSESLDYENENIERLISFDIETHNDTEPPTEKNIDINAPQFSTFSRLFVSSINEDSESDNNEILFNDSLRNKEKLGNENQVLEKTTNKSLIERSTILEEMASNFCNIPTFQRFSDDSDSDTELKISEDIFISSTTNVDLKLNQICKSQNVDTSSEMEVKTSTPISSNFSRDLSANFIVETPHKSPINMIPQKFYSDINHNRKISKLKKPRKRKDKMVPSIINSVSNDENGIFENERLSGDSNLSNDSPVPKKMKQISKSIGLKEHCTNKREPNEDNSLVKCIPPISEEKHNNFANSCEVSPYLPFPLFDFADDNSFHLPKVELVISDCESETYLDTREHNLKSIKEPIVEPQMISDISNIDFTPFNFDQFPVLPSFTLFPPNDETDEMVEDNCPPQEAIQSPLNVENSPKTVPFHTFDIPHQLSPESTSLIPSDVCLASDTQVEKCLPNWSPPVLTLPVLIKYHELDIKCYNWNHKFEDPRIRNHPNALKPNLYEWFFN